MVLEDLVSWIMESNVGINGTLQKKKKKKAALNDRRSKLPSLGMSEWVRIGASTVQRVKKKKQSDHFMH